MRLGLPPMQAQDCCTHVQEKTRHQITSRAPPLIDTCGPVSLILPPIPLLISMPIMVISIFMPAVVSMLIPPMPGRSLIVMVPGIGLDHFYPCNCGFGRNFAKTPETTAPDRVVGITAFKFHPDVRIRRGDGKKADLRPGKRHAGHCPGKFSIAQNRRDSHLDTSLLHGIQVICNFATVFAEVLFCHALTTGVSAPSPSRVSVKLCRYSPFLMAWETLFYIVKSIMLVPCSPDTHKSPRLKD